MCCFCMWCWDWWILFWLSNFLILIFCDCWCWISLLVLRRRRFSFRVRRFWAFRRGGRWFDFCLNLWVFRLCMWNVYFVLNLIVLFLLLLWGLLWIVSFVDSTFDRTRVAGASARTRRILNIWYFLMLDLFLCVLVFWVSYWLLLFYFVFIECVCLWLVVVLFRFFVSGRVFAVFRDVRVWLLFIDFFINVVYLCVIMFVLYVMFKIVLLVIGCDVVNMFFV